MVKHRLGDDHGCFFAGVVSQQKRKIDPDDAFRCTEGRIYLAKGLQKLVGQIGARTGGHLLDQHGAALRARPPSLPDQRGSNQPFATNVDCTAVTGQPQLFVADPSECATCLRLFNLPTRARHVDQRTRRQLHIRGTNIDDTTRQHLALKVPGLVQVNRREAACQQLRIRLQPDGLAAQVNPSRRRFQATPYRQRTCATCSQCQLAAGIGHDGCTRPDMDVAGFRAQGQSARSALETLLRAQHGNRRYPGKARAGRHVVVGKRRIQIDTDRLLRHGRTVRHHDVAVAADRNRHGAKTAVAKQVGGQGHDRGIVACTAHLHG
ncbi:hypothetical protein D9M72_180780 [compost metagenome]